MEALMLRGAALRIVCLSLVLGACALQGCRDEGAAPPSSAAAASVMSSVNSQSAPEGKWRTAHSFIDALDTCDIDHRGLLLDFGTDDMARRYGWALVPPTGIVHIEHDGATWGRIYDKRVSARFYLPEPSRIFVALRALGKDARRVRVLIDGYSVASLRLERRRATTKRTPLTRLPLDAGVHEVELRFAGGGRASSSDPFAEIDWLRIAGPDRVDGTYGAPTRYHLVEPKAVVGNVPYRAVALRAPSTLRCGLRIPRKARLRFNAGMRGDGAADISVKLRRDGQAVRELGRFAVQGGKQASWNVVNLPLEDHAGELAAIEVEVSRSSGTGRLFIGEPRVVVPAVDVIEPPKAKRVVVVVLDGIEHDDLPPWRKGPTPHLPNLSMLAQQATVFSNHRGPSTSVAASLASILSGRSPRGHGVVDSSRVLPEGVTTIGQIAREASVVTAMFTGVPMTSAAFGFAAHWDDYSFFAPNGGRLATAPLLDAAKWLLHVAPTKTALAVVHTRGGHPPFELTSTEAKRLPPNDYPGYLGPRRAAQELMKAQGRPGRLSEADRERLRAMFMASLAGQDEALGELIRRLSDANLYKDTLLIVTADVASGRSSLFVDGLELDEPRLHLPLYVHFPKDRLAGKVVESATEMYDITRTVTDALQLKPPAELRGRNLFQLQAEGSEAEPLRFAQLGDRYAARLGDHVLYGKLNQRPRLCQLSVDPACAFDRSAELPLVRETVFRQTARFVASEQPTTSDPIVMDSETAAVLRVWGAY